MLREKLKPNLQLKNDGSIEKWSYINKDSIKEILFNLGKGYGPCWYGNWNGIDHKVELTYQDKEEYYEAYFDGLYFKLSYELSPNTLIIHSSIKNHMPVPFQPKKCGLKLGIDTYMATYPEWLTKLFPSYLRCEKTHFTSYLMSPDEQIILMASPQPIASWSLDYNTHYSHGYKWGGHRIQTLNLDFIHQGPLPERHPQHLYELKAGEEKSWTITLQAVDTLDDVAPTLEQITHAPTFEVEQIQMMHKEEITLDIHSHIPLKIKVLSPMGNWTYYTLSPNADHVCSLSITGEEEGSYRIIAENTVGKISESIISVIKPYSWYMERAAEAALFHLPRATSHCESYYGFYSLYEQIKIDSTNKHMKDTEEIMDTIYPLIFDEEKPIVKEARIQNTAAMINILVNRYEASADIEHIHRANRLAEWLITHYQAEDGSYRGGKVHYTSVIYPAKNLMALMMVIKNLMKDDCSLQQSYDDLYTSVKAAIDELVNADGNIDTEGELTFEDGMISCSATQIAQFALLQEDEASRNHYLASAKRYLNQHTCLTQLFIPDSRMRGGTLRFWEAQYDIGMQYNFMNSPHGWSSWRTYATYYLYLLTGDMDYLVQTMNAIGSGIQSIDTHSGKLRWAFVAEPCVEVKQLTTSCKPLDINTYVEGHFNTLKYPHANFTVGEQYIDMVSHWQGANMQDNDVHEHFKCMAEIILTKAYVHEKTDGTYLTWNCRVVKCKDCIEVVPNEDIIHSVCLHLTKSTTVQLGKSVVKAPTGFSWHNV
ncbi:hypothetical protein [Vallitalea okinawensis]|uniref:hypothetical protein n=1 Tax=Vallitalea okinawensis TaxID=2078660 RepID=UPI000CFC4E14|nr:hypothetical protein [Vallitalea okinawensis]